MSLEIKQKSKEITTKGRKLEVLISQTMLELDTLIGSTLGPGGNTILIEIPGRPPLATKDGVTVAESVSFTNATKHVISEAAKEVCQRTNKQAGDGTTTAVVLAKAIIDEGLKFLNNNPMKSPQELCRELDNAVADLITNLKNDSTPVKTKDDILKVAMISSNSDDDVANAVVEAVDMVGTDGTIVTEEGKGRNTTVDLREGFTVNKGLSALGSPQEIFINSPATQECILEFPYVLLYDGDILTPQGLGMFVGGCLKEMAAENDIRPVVIMAHKFSPLTIKMFAENVRVGTANICLLETAATGQPNSKHHLLHDLSCFTGATVLDPLTTTFENASLDDLGACRKIRAGRYRSIFFEADDPNEVKKRIEILKGQVGGAESDYDSELIRERISRLSGGIANIYVGGNSDLEMREKKHRIEDTINAVRSAIEQGVVPGGGTALLVAGEKLKSNIIPSVQILSNALTVPFTRIMENAGESAEKIGEVATLIVSNYPSKVYDSLQHKFVAPYDAGIVDPVKVTITALENAMSIAKMLMTIGGTVVIPRDAGEEAQAEVAAQNFAKQMQGS